MGAVDFDDAGMVVQSAVNLRAVFEPLNGVVVAAARESDFSRHAHGPDGVAQKRLVHLTVGQMNQEPRCKYWATRSLLH